jgi:hypothetical protein
LGEKKELTGGSHLSARGERRAVPIREEGSLGRGLILSVGPKGSPGPFLYFYFLFFFSLFFLISDLFPNLLQIVSIQSKQIPSAYK